MEWIVWISIWIAIGLLKALARRAERNPRRKVETLCLTCVNALVTKTNRRKALVNCICGGSVRRMKVAVCQCTGYAPRGLGTKLVTIEGFVREEPVVYEEVAIR